MKFKVFLFNEEDVFTQNTPPVHFEEYELQISPQCGDIIALNQNRFFVVTSRMIHPDGDNRIMLFGKTVVKGIAFRKKPKMINIDVVIKKLEEFSPELVDKTKTNPFLHDSIEYWYNELKQMHKL